MDYIRPHPNPPLSKGRVLLGGWGYPSQTLFELVLETVLTHGVLWIQNLSFDLGARYKTW